MSIFPTIKQQVQIETVVNEYTTLKQAGTYLKARCPFHHEKTASFTVSPHRGIFYCFGCQITGDVISFMSKVENCSQIEAARLLAQRYNIDISHLDTPDNAGSSRSQRESHETIVSLTAQWCHQQLKKNRPAQRYLITRKISETSIAQFGIGFFPAGAGNINDLVRTAGAQQLLVQDLIDAKVLFRGRTTLYSPFENRIIFPIRDQLGRGCGLGGRIFKSGDTRPKYYNSSDSPYFSKGSLLFGLDEARKAAQKNGNMFLVEGYTDCIAMHEHGYANTVATLGTACTAQHLKLLARYTPNVCLLYDNDTAGTQAIMRITNMCWEANLDLSVITLPRGQDPASLLAKDETLTPYIERARDIFCFFIEEIGSSFIRQPLAQRLAHIKHLLETIAHIGDPLKRDILLKRASDTLDIPFETLAQELARIISSDTETTAKREDTPRPAPKPPLLLQTTPLEKRIFCAIMRDSSLLDSQNKEYLLEYLPQPLQDILTVLLPDQSEGKPDELIKLLERLDAPQRQYVDTMLLEHSEPVGMTEFESLLLQLHRARWRDIVEEVKVRLAQARADNNTQKVQEIITHFLKLKQRVASALDAS